MSEHIYENHLGGLYALPFYDPYQLETCEQCGDSDEYLGKFETWQELKAELTDEDGWCPYSEEHLQELREAFE